MGPKCNASVLMRDIKETHRGQSDGRQSGERSGQKPWKAWSQKNLGKARKRIQ